MSGILTLYPFRRWNLREVLGDMTDDAFPVQSLCWHQGLADLDGFQLANCSNLKSLLTLKDARSV